MSRQEGGMKMEIAFFVVAGIVIVSAVIRIVKNKKEK